MVVVVLVLVGVVVTVVIVFLVVVVSSSVYAPGAPFIPQANDSNIFILPDTNLEQSSLHGDYKIKKQQLRCTASCTP